MTKLLNKPEVLNKAKEEIDTRIGIQDRLVDEQDLPKLSYLQNIINETLCFYPPAPLLLPHESSKVCTIEGYHIPRDTIVLTNSDPTSFMPERFEKEREVNKLIAFGLGRRACPGSGLAQRTVGLTMTFEEKLDMVEDNGGIISSYLIPFQAMCKALPIINDFQKKKNIVNDIMK
ncbi:hypothetical protein JHK86_024131 [Glycine max]|nr:hypothetical protein JHK86_024131 [Glycine max]